MNLLQLALTETEGWPVSEQIGRVIWTSGNRFAMLTKKGDEIWLMVTGCGVECLIFTRRPSLSPYSLFPWEPLPEIAEAYAQWMGVVKQELKHGYRKRGR